jgi:hypothetical protein
MGFGLSRRNANSHKALGGIIHAFNDITLYHYPRGFVFGRQGPEVRIFSPRPIFLY